MGLPPTQGHNILRLSNTANLYPNYYRLANNTHTQYTRKHNHHQHKFNYYQSHLHSHSQSHSQHPQTNKHSHSYFGSSHSNRVQKNSSFAFPSSTTRKYFTQIENIRTKRNYSNSHPRPIQLIHRNIQPPTSLPTKRIGSIRSNDLRRYHFDDNLFPIGPYHNSHSHRKRSIVSNMPLLNVNSSIVMVNHSPFGLRDPRFGILHHCSQSISYF